MKNLFTKKEIVALAILAALGLASYFSGLDYYVADKLGARTPGGISLFFSSTYYVAFILLGVIVASVKNRRAGAALLASIIIVFLIQAAFTDFAPRARPPQAQHIGDSLMYWIEKSGTTSSFPSGHTMISTAVFTTLLLLDIHPLLVLLLALPIAISRIFLVQHYISDVMGGIIVGYVTTKITYWMIVRPDR